MLAARTQRAAPRYRRVGWRADHCCLCVLGCALGCTCHVDATCHMQGGIRAMSTLSVLLQPPCNNTATIFAARHM